MRFGVQCLGATDGAAWRDLAHRVEGAGFDVLSVADHFVAGCLAPFTAMAIAAEATTRLRVASLVLNNDFRHPVVVASEILALDALSGGRVELGLGAGHGFPEYESSGIAFDDASVRIDRLRESVTILDSLLRGEATTFAGTHYTLDAHRAWPASTQSPRPPILIGGNGRQLLRVAATHADIVGLSGTGKTKADGLTHDATGFVPEAVDERIALVRDAAAGRPIELHALVQQVVVTDDPRRAAERLAPHLPEISVDDILRTPYLWIGSVDSICDNVLAAHEHWGFSYFTVFEHSLDAALPIVERLVSETRAPAVADAAEEEE